LRIGLRRSFAASILDARVLVPQQAPRSAAGCLLLQTLHYTAMLENLRGIFGRAAQRAAWECWHGLRRKRRDEGILISSRDTAREYWCKGNIFRAWLQNARAGARFKHLCRCTIVKWLHRCMAQSFTGWLQAAAHRRRTRDIFCKVVGRWRHTHLSHAWYRWCEALRLGDLLAQGLASRHRRIGSGVLRSWVAHVEASLRFQDLAPRVAGRWRNLLLSSTFRGWLQHAACCVMLREVCQRVMHASVYTAWWAWQSNVVFLVRLREVCRRIMHSGLCRSLRRWHFRARRQDTLRKVCVRLVLRWRQLAMYIAWQTWQSSVTLIVRVRTMLNRSQEDWHQYVQHTLLTKWCDVALFRSDLRAQLVAYHRTCSQQRALAAALGAWRIMVLASQPSQRLRNHTSINSSFTAALCPEAKRGLPQLLPDAGLFDSIVEGLSTSLGAKPGTPPHRHTADHAPELDLSFCFPERFLHT
jgi:hypothetical protein